jgi:type IV pilus assembly protein PilX
MRSAKTRVIPTGRQQGAVLVVSLSILLILSLISITAVRNTTLQERMAGNALDLNAAFQSSESALRVGENWLQSLIEEPVRADQFTTGCGSGGKHCIWEKNKLFEAAGVTSYTSNQVWSLTSGAGITQLAADTIPDVSEQPRYVVEFIDFIRDGMNLGQQQDIGQSSYRAYYRVTAKGNGRSTAETYVASTYARRY